MLSNMQRIVRQLNFPAGLFSKQTAIITGSGQGIGAECARLFANEGAKVVVCDIDEAKSSAVAKSINEVFPGRAISVPGDVSDNAYYPRLLKDALEFGNGSLDVLVNNAGYTWDGMVHKMSDKQWDAILDIHATAPFKLIREAAPHFKVKDGKRRVITNVSSTSGTHGNVGQANYTAGKAAVIGLTKTIAKEWGPQFGVCANAVVFGRIDTRLTNAKENGEYITTPTGERVALGIPAAQLGSPDTAEQRFKDIPLGRSGTTTEAAGAILAVSSPYFGYVSGQVIEVTGGRNI